MEALDAVGTGIILVAVGKGHPDLPTICGKEKGSSCVGVFKNIRAKIMANNHRNRITPSYVTFMTNDERLTSATP